MKKDEFILIVVKDIEGKEIKRVAITKEEFDIIATIMPKLEKCKEAKKDSDTKELVLEDISKLYNVKTKYRKGAHNVNYIEMGFVSKKG